MYMIAQDRGVAGRWYLSVTGRWTRFLADAAVMDGTFVRGLFNPAEHVLLRLENTHTEEGDEK